MHRRTLILLRKCGFSLVSTLVVLTLLAVVVTSFLSSMSSERKTAHAFGNATRAEFAAQAAVAEGITLLKSHFQSHPDSATAWEGISYSGTLATLGTVLYYRDQPDPATGVSQVFMQPLMSGAIAQPVGQSSMVLKVADVGKGYGNPDNSIDFNRARFLGDTQGWIGSPSVSATTSTTAPMTSGTTPMRIPVPWKEMTEVSGTSNKVIARYAFWVEDESFKINANLAGKSPRSDTTAGDSPSQIPFQGLLQAAAAASADLDASAASVVDARDGFISQRFHEFRAINQVSDVQGLADSAKFEGTIFSGALNLSRSGALRLNLNRVVQDSFDPDEVRSQLDEIIEAINQQIPKFGQRFYRTDPSDLNGDQVRKDATYDDQDTYLQKIAANIHDYIDTDSQPTIVNRDKSVNIAQGGNKPATALEPANGNSGDNPALAIGKENVPYLQEYAVRVTLHSFDPTIVTGSSGSAYSFDLDYYFEFWNMTSKDISVPNGDLGVAPFIKVYNQALFDSGTGGTPIPEGREFEIALSGNTGDSVVFPAGQCTVITTDLDPSSALIGAANRAHVLKRQITSGAGRHYAGTTFLKDGSLPRLNMKGRPLSSDGASPDYQTKMVFGNERGLIDSVFTIAIIRANSGGSYAFSINNDDNDSVDAQPEHEINFIRGASLSGTAPLYQYGDPRTNNEQLTLLGYVPSTDSNYNDQSRYFTSGLDNHDRTNAKPDSERVPAHSSLGAPNSFYVHPGLDGNNAYPWPDPFSWSPAGVDAPMVVANAPMKSIGELGHIFDPARHVGNSGDIRLSRGGGRTLKIGQSDPLWDKNSESHSHEWAAWRLADIFCTSDEIQQEGRININGVRRDNGAALRASLYGYQFAPDSDGGIASAPLTSDAIDTLVQQIMDRLNNVAYAYPKSPTNASASTAVVPAATSQTVGPFVERGELSELPMFYTGPALAAGVDTGALNDRTREELFRRLVELITTRGNVFSVYAVGQAIQQTPDGSKRVTATFQTKVTFELDPHWSNQTASTAATFDPNDSDAVRSRFSRPDFYTVKILQVTSN